MQLHNYKGVNYWLVLKTEFVLRMIVEEFYQLTDHARYSDEIISRNNNLL